MIHTVILAFKKNLTFLFYEIFVKEHIVLLLEPWVSSSSYPAGVTLSKLGRITGDGLSYPCWVTLPKPGLKPFTVWLTLLSLGYFTQSGQLYPGLVTLPSLGNLTKPLLPNPPWVTLPRVGKLTQAG